MNLPRLPLLALTLWLGIAAHAQKAPGNITILRDAYGTPHIFADSEASACYGLGYAQAQDRLEGLLRNYRQARGDLAEVDGPAALESDLQSRAFLLGDIARRQFPGLPAEVRAEIEAFCAGVNRWQRENPARRPIWAFEVLPSDVVAFGLFLNLAFSTDPFEPPMTPDPPPAPAPQNGSNAFAVAAKKTGSGKGSLVSMDPHLPWGGFYRWYEAHVSGGALDVQGATFAGLPYVVMGHNGKVAWANTVNQPDLSDLYEIRPIAEQGPPRYEYDGQQRPVVLRELPFRIRRPDGGIDERSRTIGYTHQGPVLLRSGGKAYAVRKAGWGDSGIFAQVRAMNLAGTADEFRTALAERHIVMFNFLFGDASGRIGYVWNGRIPTRPDGYDFRSPVPGWTSETEWKDPVAFDQLPQSVDPPGGVLFNANNDAFTSGAGESLKPFADPKQYPLWLAPLVPSLRADRLRALLPPATGIELPEARTIATDIQDLNAARLLPGLLAAIQKELPERSSAEKELLVRCQRVLSDWDRTLAASARGAALFQLWTEAPEREGKPDSDDRASVAALLATAGRMAAKKVPIDVPWGEMHRHRRGKVDLPLDGGQESLTPNAGPIGPDGKITARFGSSFRMLVRLGDGEPKVLSITPYGISDDPQSKHYADQMPLAARREYRVVPYARRAVEKEATARLTLTWPEKQEK